MNHAFPGAPRGDESQWVQLPLPGVRGLPGAQPAPLGSVDPQIPLDASARHFHPSKNRQALPNGLDSPSSHCTVAPGQPLGLRLPHQQCFPTSDASQQKKT